ncbi:hypothetical protein ABTY59_35915 [Streptomyces sp. NPDC096079]|uniref:terpene synthase family protein n=1 Tax=Streptomyces sp. NPDC096079 TaxID=3155820 RepID=UPI00331A9971
MVVDRGPWDAWASEEVAIPDLALPFPTRMNPYRDYCAQDVRWWIQRVGLIDLPKAGDCLSVSAPDLAAAVSVPEASRSGLSLMTRWFAWCLVFDDTSVDRTIDFTVTTRGLQEVLGARPVPPGDALVAAFADLFDQTCARGSAAWRERFGETLNQLIGSLLEERHANDAGEWVSVEAYVLRRRVNGALPLLYDLNEIVLNCEVPDIVRASDAYRRCVRTSTDAVDFINDIYSLPKELAARESTNLVMMLAHENGSSLAAAMAQAVSYVHEAVAGFLAAEQDLHLELPRLELDLQQRRAAMTMIASMRDWIGGLPAYQRLAERY